MMRSSIIVVGIWASIIYSQNSYSQDLSRLSPEKPIRDLVLHQWTAEDGLISNNLTSVNYTSDGFIWVTCFNGAIKFDGHGFQLYDRKNLDILRSNAFISSFEDDDNIWFATQGSGILKYSNWEFEEFSMNSDIPRYIRAVHKDKDGRLWIGANNLGLYIFENDRVEKITYPGLTEVSIMDIERDNLGRKYFGTAGKGFSVYQNGEFSSYSEENGLASNLINDVFVSTTGEVYLATLNGISVFDGEQLRTLDFLKGTEINKIAEDNLGSLWFATEMGLGRTNERYGIEEFFTVKEGLPTRQISGLSFDHEGNLWLSTKKGGLVQLKNGNFINYTQQDGLALDRVNIAVEKEDGTYFIGSDDGEINILTGNKITNYNFRTSLENHGVRDIAFDDRGYTWIASYRGLLRKKGNEERFFDLSTGLPAQDIRRILIDSRGFMWLGTRSGGVIKMRDGNILKVYDRSNGLASNYVLAVEEDIEGIIWLGTNGGGITSISPDGIINKFTISDDASGELFFNITIDKNNTKWLSTNIGVFRFDGDKFKNIELESSYQNDTFFDIVYDNTGNLWISSNIGLYRALDADVGKFISGEIDAVPIRLFDHTDGLVNKECTGATRLLEGSDGKIYIPTLGGLAILDPENVIENQVPPLVYVTDFLTDRSGTFQSEDFMSGSMEIPPGNYRYIFKYTALSYEAAEKVRFMYKLEGIDKEWISVRDKREVQYTNLPPGKYKFQVRACNNDGYWNETGAIISLKINPWLYQRVGFWIVILVIATILLWVLYKTKIKQIEYRNKELSKINNELDKFVYSASHDLKAPLASVLGLVNLARRDNSPSSIPLYLDMIEKSVNKLEWFIKDIIDYSRNTRIEVMSDNIDFNKIIGGTFEDLQYLDKEGKVKKNISIEGNGYFKSDERRISVILHNLISNSFKYHDYTKDQPEINVKAKIKPELAKIFVTDNGHGISEEHIQRIFEMFYRGTTDAEGSGLGLFIVRETVEKIGGKIIVESTTGKGTTFILELPSIN